MSPSIHYHQLVICHTQTAGFDETVKGFHLGRLATNKSPTIFGDVWVGMVGIIYRNPFAAFSFLEYMIVYAIEI